MIAKILRSYLAIRRAAGFELRSWGALLLSFSRFADSRGDKHIKVSTVEAWAALGSSAPQRERRVQTVIPFARFARGEDMLHEIPRRSVFAHDIGRRPTPFLFTDEQVCRLLKEAERLPAPDSVRSHTYRTLFGLLAATGLRISEALALKISDVTADGLLIRMTKFRKSRLVPLHRSVVSAVAHYLRHRRPGVTDHVFVTDIGAPVRYSQASYRFGCMLRAAGIGPGEKGAPRPHIHSLRHTFAVRVLETSPSDPTRIAHHMVALTTYLGHAHVSSTYWYLQATPKVMADIAEACETFVQGGAV